MPSLPLVHWWSASQWQANPLQVMVNQSHYRLPLLDHLRQLWGCCGWRWYLVGLRREYREGERKICYPMFLLLKVCIHQSRFHPFHKTHHHLNNLSVTPYLPNTSSSPLFPSATGLLKSALITALSTLGMLYHWDSNWNWSDTTPKRFFFFLNVWKWLKFPTVLGFKFTKLSLWMSRYLPHHISTLSQHRHRPCSHPLPAEMTTRSLGCLALFTFRSRWLLQEHFTKSFTCAWSTSYCTAHH